MRICRLAIAVAALLWPWTVVASDSITSRAQGSTGWSMDFALDSVTGNIRQMMTLFDPVTGLLISPLASGGPVNPIGFNAAVTGTPLSVTTTSATSTSFTSSPEVLVTNVGTNAAYCIPGAGPATTSHLYLSPGGGWFTFYASGGITQISCITGASTTTVNILAGSGLPSGGVSPGPAIVGAAPGVAVASGNTVSVQYPSLDACQTQANTSTPISITTAANTKIVTGTSAKKTYICSLFLFTAAAENVAIVEGTGTNCATATVGVIGGATAANGVNLAANQGFMLGNGEAAIAQTATAADDLCLITSAATVLAGVAVTAQQ